ncbi:hypothetical protein CYMTET_55019, partial [Cymbomonas tetramitiformis]
SRKSSDSTQLGPDAVSRQLSKDMGVLSIGGLCCRPGASYTFLARVPVLHKKHSYRFLLCHGSIDNNVDGSYSNSSDRSEQIVEAEDSGNESEEFVEKMRRLSTYIELDERGRPMLAPDDDIDEPEEVDTRVGSTLEQLNIASCDINKLESELEKARKWYRHVGAETERQCQELSKGLARNIRGAMIYYHKKRVTELQQTRAHEAAEAYDLAYDTYEASKVKLRAAEEGVATRSCETPHHKLDSEAQDAVNLCIANLLEAQQRKVATTVAHQAELERTSAMLQELDVIGKAKKRDIRKSRHYFEAKEKSDKLRQEALTAVQTIEAQLSRAKRSYAEALALLNVISEEVHSKRQDRRREPDDGTA